MRISEIIAQLPPIEIQNPEDQRLTGEITIHPKGSNRLTITAVAFDPNIPVFVEVSTNMGTADESNALLLANALNCRTTIKVLVSLPDDSNRCDLLLTSRLPTKQVEGNKGDSLYEAAVQHNLLHGLLAPTLAELRKQPSGENFASHNQRENIEALVKQILKSTF